MEWVAQKEPRVIALKQDAMLRRFLSRLSACATSTQRFQPQTHIDVETLLRLCSQLELTPKAATGNSRGENEKRANERAKLREKSNDITVIENVLNSLNE